MKGPVKPPISPMEKKRPPMTPILPGPISDIFINVTIRIGMSDLVKKPAATMPNQRPNPVPRPVISMDAPEIARIVAMIRFILFGLNRNRGTIRPPKMPDSIMSDVA